jgi:hypothetical protein
MYVVVIEAGQIKGVLVLFFMVKKCYMSSDIVSQFPLILNHPIEKKCYIEECLLVCIVRYWL